MSAAYTPPVTITPSSPPAPLAPPRANGAPPSASAERAAAGAVAPYAPAGRGAIPPPVFDEALEEAEYCRALLPADELADLKKELADLGVWDLETVRELVRTNTTKESMEFRGETYVLDPELLMSIDLHTDYPVFVASDNIYGREELMAAYPFAALQNAPEFVFVQQEIGVFPPREPDGEAYEYVARDAGSAEPFVRVEDLVGVAARKGYTAQCPPLRVVKTKVFVGKERWRDFSAMLGFIRGVRQFIAPLRLGFEPSEAETCQAIIFGAAGGRQPPPPAALQDSETAAKEAAERLRREAEELARRGAELRRREEELQAREEAAARRERDAMLRSLGLDPSAMPAERAPPPGRNPPPAGRDNGGRPPDSPAAEEDLPWDLDPAVEAFVLDLYGAPGATSGGSVATRCAARFAADTGGSARSAGAAAEARHDAVPLDF